MNEFQVLGSAITYVRRYALSSALGLITDKDTDAAGEQVKSKKIPLKVGDSNWPNVVKSVQGGFKIDQIKSKYEFDERTEVELKTQAGV